MKNIFVVDERWPTATIVIPNKPGTYKLTEFYGNSGTHLEILENLSSLSDKHFLLATFTIK